MKSTTIYALIDSNNPRPFYVGLTNNAGRRFNEHINESKRCANKNIIKEAYIRDRINLGIKVEMIVLEVVNSQEKLTAERFWINHCQKYGLTNIVDNVLPAQYKA